MIAPKHEFVCEWPGLKLGEIKMSTEVHRHDDGRHHVFLLDEESRDKRMNSDDMACQTRLGFRIYGNEVILLGILLDPSLRGKKLGSTLLKYFIESTRSAGLTFIGTGLIHKPIVAKELAEFGLKPESDDFIAEILPRSKYNTSHTPDITILKNSCDPSRIIQGSKSGKFYREVSAEDRLKIPIGSPTSIVALHTSYCPA